ncbi:cilia- and flagella-associated protein 337-like [Tubulanus polymorphus]|uniref:cilia- and flagella-associated protein 337-like n=1 Tax=Tubulanus polymorphus TaxID=672921 RepID=UPI003DA3B121
MDSPDENAGQGNTTVWTASPDPEKVPRRTSIWSNDREGADSGLQNGTPSQQERRMSQFSQKMDSLEIPRTSRSVFQKVSSAVIAINRMKRAVNNENNELENSSAQLVQSDGKTTKKSGDSVKLEEQITNEKLTNLQQIFEEADEDGGGGLDIDEFRYAMRQTMGAVDDHELEIVFMKVDTNCDGTVDWDEYLSYMLLEYKEKDQMTSMLQEKPFPKSLKDVECNHRDDITTITFLPSLINRHGNSADDIDYLHGRYITISKEGVINLWSLDMNHLKTYHANGSNERTRSIWVTDLVCMPNVSMVAIASTQRDIALYDLNASKFEKHYRISGLDHCALCMDYWFDTKDMNKGILLWGDGGGNVCGVKFNECMLGGLFGAYPGKQVHGQRIPFPELLKGQAKGVQAYRMTGLHDDWVSQVKYFPTLDSFISCSVSSTNSMYLGDFEQKKSSSYFSVKKGILCFDYSKITNIIVTGGVDHLVRLWNPYVTSKAIVVFKGHAKAVTHVMINNVREQVISIAKDKTIRVFNMADQSCAQVIPGIKIPMGPHVISAAFYNPQTQSLILTTNQLAYFERKDEERHQEIKSHMKPICAALYNKLFNQVVSACHASVVSVWDLDTGQKVIQFTNAHKVVERGEERGVEITAMEFDPTGRRLITGARDGTVKIWNFNNGACLRELDTPGGCEVTGIVCPKQRIVIAGWNRRISTFIDAKDAEDIGKVWASWHKDDILSVAFYPRSSIIATSSYNGDIIIWSLETAHALSHINVNESAYPQTTSRLSTQYFSNRSCSSLESSKTPVKGGRAITVKEMIALNTQEATAGRRSGMSTSHGHRSGWKTPEIDGRRTSFDASSPVSNRRASVADRGSSKRRGSRVNTGGSDSRKDKSNLESCAEDSEHDATPPSPGIHSLISDDSVKLTQSLIDAYRNKHAASVDNIVFLQTRETGPSTATLMAAGAEGWVRAWSIHHKGGLKGQFIASHKPGESITAMSTDTKNQFLMTGDTLGYVKIWDITEYCISKRQLEQMKPVSHEELEKLFPYVRFANDPIVRKIKRRAMANVISVSSEPPPTSKPDETMHGPPTLNSFKAHTKAVTHIEFVEDRKLLITSSLDCSVRLWTLCGRYIGTFGQPDPWEKLPKVMNVKEREVTMPPDIRKCASAGTLQVLKGGMAQKWKMARNIVLIWLTKARKQQQHLDSLNESIIETPHTDTDEDESEKEPALEHILGRHYKAKVRHRIPPQLPPIRHNQSQVVVYSSLPFHDMVPINDFVPPPFLQEVLDRQHGGGAAQETSKFGQKMRTFMSKQRTVRALNSACGANNRRRRTLESRRKTLFRHQSPSSPVSSR